MKILEKQLRGSRVEGGGEYGDGRRSRVKWEEGLMS